MSLQFEPRTTTTVVACVIAVLVATLAVMGYSLYQMNAKLNSLVENDATALERGTSGNSDAAWRALGSGPAAPEWDPFQEMEMMQERIDQLFNNAFGRLSRGPNAQHFLSEFNFSPQLDLTDEGEVFVARVDIPGAEEATINVSVEDQILTVEAVSKSEAKADNVLRRERFIGQFRRQVKLPAPVDPTSAETEYKDGVVTVTIRKAADSEITAE